MDYVTKIGVLSPAFPIFAKIMWIMLQILVSKVLRLQYSQRPHGLCRKNLCLEPSIPNLCQDHVDHVANFGVEGLATPIFAETIWIMSQKLVSWAQHSQSLPRSCGSCGKNWRPGLCDSNICRDHMEN